MKDEIEGCQINFKNSTGRERNLCPVCEKPFKKEEEVISFLKNIFKGNHSYGLIHSRCFFKFLLNKYNFDLDEIKKEIIIEKIK